MGPFNVEGKGAKAIRMDYSREALWPKIELFHDLSWI